MLNVHTITFGIIKSSFDTCIIKEKIMFDNEEYEQTFVIKSKENQGFRLPYEAPGEPEESQDVENHVAFDHKI